MKPFLFRIIRIARIFQFVSLILLLVSSCESPENSLQPTTEKRFEYLDAAHTGVRFINIIREEPGRNVGTYDYMYNGGGVAIADFNNDSRPDLFFTGNDTDNKLYLNKGNFKFEDISAEAGIESKGKWATGVTVVDINNDGWRDIYVCYSGPDYQRSSIRNELFINNKDNSFTEQAARFGVDHPGLSTQAVFFDMDADGDLDLWVMNHAVRNWANTSPEWLRTAAAIPVADQKKFSNALFRNDGNEVFVDISKAAGVAGIGFGLGIAVTDFNEDGLPDVFVANDYFIPDRLYINQGNGVFTDRAESKFSHTSHYSMGCDAADFNNDGRVDLAVLDMTPADHYRNKMLMASMDVGEFTFLTEVRGFNPQYMFNSLYRNDGSGVMSDIAHMAGVAKTDWSWAALFADLDNDGFKDLYVSNGVYRDVLNNDWRLELMEMLEKENFSAEDYFTHLQKTDSTPIINDIFENINPYTFKSRKDEWGLDKTSFSNGVAYGDLDQDGDLDIVVNNLGQEAFICRNNSRELSGEHFFRLTLDNKKNDFSVDGSRVELYSNGNLQLAEYRFTRGYQSCMEPIVHFGLGENEVVDSVVIHWPNRRNFLIVKPQADQVHHVNYDEKKTREPVDAPIQKLFWDVTDVAMQFPAVHVENRFNDFEKEILLPHRMSQLGPALAVADVNADGLEDFYCGGARDQSGSLYVQNEKGYFIPVPTSAFDDFRSGEELGAIFLDVDNDEDQDLYVARGGGGDVADQPALFSDLLYLNDGKGVFTIYQEIPMSASTKSLAAIDWDNDGDLDLFVGGRVVPGKYPKSPASYLLENRNGRFHDVTKDKGSAIQHIGMVTDAKWITGEGDIPKLLIVGEWMSPQLFVWEADHLVPDPEFNLAHSSGWWSSIATGDFDGDGRSEIVLGNLGLNNKFHPSTENPLYLFANDFDDNGTLDIVLSKNYKDRLVPVRGRECSSSQMPFIKEEFKTYHEFATAGLDEIYAPQKIESSIGLQANGFESVMLRKEGNQWITKSLPLAAQVSPIQGMIVDDFDNDGHADLFIAGNNFATEVETTPYDSGKGLLLKGDGNGDFNVVYEYESGIFLPGDVRCILPVQLSSDGIRGILVANNDGKVRLLMHTGE